MWVMVDWVGGGERGSEPRRKGESVGWTSG